MPIDSIRLRHFRCFADSGEIPVRPLTVILGRNNTGKSSILQSLFLLRQTVDRPEGGERLNIRGPLFQAGSYADLVHDHRARRNMTMEYGLGLSNGSQQGRVELEFASDDPQPPRLASIRVEPLGVEAIEIRRGRGRGGPCELSIGASKLGDEASADFRFAVNQFMSPIGSEPPQKGPRSSTREQSRTGARLVLHELETVLTNIRAVGPFRQEPARRYDYQGRPAEAIDLRGENAVQALIEDSTRRGLLRGQLLASVNEWLTRVGRVRLLPLRRLNRTIRLYEVRLKDVDSGRWVNFADVGFGIGQAFPVLVEGLRTRKDGLFIVQEPEIHLHPDAQVAIADFLVDLAQSGRRVIVETHSEAVLLRIRHRILGVRNGRRLAVPRLRPDDVSIICFAQHRGGASYASALTVDALGQIAGWPAGFMEEVTRERLQLLKSLAATSKKGV
ncbi:MAG: AAA family ATPase [Planctomycetota bacterium]